MELIERDVTLAALHGLLQTAAQHGRIALVAGEAGIGKTSVLRALATQHTAVGGAVWWGACDALETPHPLAPLLDMARDAGARFASRIDGPRPALFEAVLDDLRLAVGPVLVVVEDAHWADDATLDWLKYLGRRIERTHALLAISYRDDEVTATHPLRRVLGELPPAARAHLPLPRLSRAAVQTLATQAGRRAEGVYEATQGNAFFVTELLRDGVVPPSVPHSVQDLVLARFARLPDGAQALLRVVAVVPGRTERWLADALAAPSLDDLEAALASGLLVAEDRALSYRHELGRVTVDASLSPPLRQSLHARVLAALSDSADARHPVPPARLVHHALQADDVAAISRHAPAAAAEATQRGALREAVQHWTTALQRGRPADVAQEERWLDAAAIALTRLGVAGERESYLTRLEAMARARGDLAEAARHVSRRAGVWVGRMDHARALAINADALAMVEALPPSSAKAFVWHNEAHLRMLERDCDDSVAWARRTLDLADAIGDEAMARAARGVLGCALLFIDHPAGVAELEAVGDALRRSGNMLGAAGALSNLGSGAGELMLLVRAEAALREAVELAVASEADGTRDYAQAWLALVRMHRGDWREAGRLADEALARPGLLAMSRLMATVALARLRGRRGDPGVDDALAEVGRLGGASRTLQRLAPACAVHAEAAFARGDLDAVAREVARVLPLAQAKRHPWFVGELNYWLWRSGRPEATGAGCAEPFALEIGGRWREAAAAWQALDCPYEQARALALGDAAAQREALAIFDRLGAAPAADALRRRLREAGVRGLERGARASTREHPAGLTRAEGEVLALLADGLRNAEIAARLHRSVRTVDHHVAAVLAKLGVDSRSAAVDRARREGWLPVPEPGRGAN